MTRALVRTELALPALVTDCRLPDVDGCFAMLTDACRDLDSTQGHLFHAQLVLLLANHIGDPQVLREAIDLARTGLNLPDIALVT